MERAPTTLSGVRQVT